MISDTFTLPNGAVRWLHDVYFRPSSNRFFYGVDESGNGGLDVTDYLSLEQKKSFSGYDLERAALEASRYANLNVGSTSVLGNFVDNVLKNPLGDAPKLWKEYKAVAYIVIAIMLLWAFMPLLRSLGKKSA